MLQDPNQLPYFYATCQKQLVKRLTIGRKVFNHDDLIANFKANNIMVKTRSDQTLKFKYNILCKFNQPFQHACRGTTILGDGTVIPALNKFFNHSQLKRQYGFNYQQLWDSYAKPNCRFIVDAMYKIDGTNIQITYLKNQDRFEITTLGSLNAVVMQGKMPNSPTFEQMFIRLAQQANSNDCNNSNDSNDYNDNESNSSESNVGSNNSSCSNTDLFTVMKQYPNYSLVFEMCSKYNKIVTNYDKEFIQLLAIIDLDSGYPIKCPELVSELNMVGIEMAKSWPISSNNPQQDIDNILTEITSNPQLYGHNPEGLVFNLYFAEYNANIPFVKYKRKEYLEQIGNVVMAVGNFQDLCRVEQLVLQDKDDDLQHEVQQQHAYKFREFIATTCNQIQDYIDQLAKCSSAKHYASMVQQLTANSNKQKDKNDWIKPFLFEIKSLVLQQEDADAWQLLSMWLLKSTNSGTKLSKLQSKGDIDNVWFNK